MNGLNYVKSKQIAWAKRNNLTLYGSQFPNKGEKAYLDEIAKNLFMPLSNESRNQFKKGDGNEMKDTGVDGSSRAKMKALHSSSALPVNLFQYWQNRNDIYKIAYVCGLCRKDNRNANKIEFEKKFPIFKNSTTNPNIDVVIECNNDDNLYAIESKFSEPYSNQRKKSFSDKYFENDLIWDKLPNLKKLAEDIMQNNEIYKYLDVAQLIKHILGLTKNHNKSNFRLLYLWYDVVGQDGFEHRKEIEQFAEIAKKDNVRFSHITYQEVILKLSKEFYEGNEEYVNYLTDRYI